MQHDVMDRQKIYDDLLSQCGVGPSTMQCDSQSTSVDTPRKSTSMAKRKNPSKADAARTGVAIKSSETVAKRRRTMDADLENMYQAIHAELNSKPSSNAQLTAGRRKRQDLLKVLSENLAKRHPDRAGSVGEWCRSFESCLYDKYYLYHGELYAETARDVFLLSSNEHCKPLTDYDPSLVAGMTAAEMRDHLLYKPVAEKESREGPQSKPNLPQLESLHRCGKCKSNKVTYTQMQTRSMDEPVTIFYHCENCQNRWKQCG